MIPEHESKKTSGNVTFVYGNLFRVPHDPYYSSNDGLRDAGITFTVTDARDLEALIRFFSQPYFPLQVHATPKNKE